MTAFLVDARGLKCPLPVLLARRALRTHPLIELQTTDPASVLDIPVFCAEAGYLISGQTQTVNIYTYLIRSDEKI